VEVKDPRQTKAVTGKWIPAWLEWIKYSIQSL
jgi:hypothetical protein